MPNLHSTEPDNDSQKQFGSERKVTRDAMVAVFAKFVGQQEEQYKRLGFGQPESLVKNTVKAEQGCESDQDRDED